MRKVWAPDLSSLREEMATLCLEVRSLAENDILVVPLVITYFIPPLSWPSTVVFGLFIKDDVAAIIVTKKDQEELYDPTMDC